MDSSALGVAPPAPKPTPPSGTLGDAIPAAIDTAAIVPRDMTVRLVRADSAGWEIFLQGLYSFCLTIAGLFGGAWLADVQSGTSKFGFFEKVSFWVFTFLSVALVVAWIVLKVKQGKKVVKIPLHTLQAFEVAADKDDK